MFVHTYRLHYIPLSQGYQEVYNIYSFFHGPTHSMLEAVNSTALQGPVIPPRNEETDRLLRRIARAGKHWKQTMARKIDMEGKSALFRKFLRDRMKLTGICSS